MYRCTPVVKQSYLQIYIIIIIIIVTIINIITILIFNWCLWNYII